jgi:integral membrane protein
MTSLTILRLAGILEGFSWLALLTTMTLKYGFEITEPNVLAGKIHGFLFIGYVFMVFIVAMDKKWGMKTSIWCLIASFLPFGTFIADYKILKKA